MKSTSLTRWLPLALLCLTILVLFHRLVLGETLFWGLPSLQFYPWREFAMSEFAQGRLPLWNPYNGAGAPLLANYQSAMLYPPHLLYLLWSGPQMIGWLGLLHIAFAGYGMWRLTGHLGCIPLGRGIATLAYPLSSTLIARFGTLPMLDTAAWLPWLILATDALVDGVTPWRIAALTTVTAMQLLAGHAQWTFYSFVLAGSYGLWRLIAPRDKRTLQQTIRVAIGAIAAIALAVGIAAAQLLPTAELQGQSQRAGGVDESFALNFSYAPLSLVTLFNPNFFGNPGDGTYVINGAYFETTAYIGILPAILAILGTIRYLLLRRRKRRGLPTPDLPLRNGLLIIFFALVTLVSLLLAFGSFTPIYPFLYRYIPTFKLFQAPARWLLLTVFSLAMLAALVMPLWKPARRTQRPVWIGVVGGASMILAGLIAPLILPKAAPFTAQLLHSVMVTGVLLLIVSIIFVSQPAHERQRNRWATCVLIFVALDLWWANSLSNPTVPAQFYAKQPTTSTGRVFWPDKTNQQLPQTAFTDYLPLNNYVKAVEGKDAYRRSELPNLNLLDRQSSLNSFEPLRPDGFEQFAKLLNDTMSPALLQAAAISKVIGGDAAPGGVSRVWISSTVESLTDSDAVEKAMSDKNWDPEETVFITAPLSPALASQPSIELGRNLRQVSSLDITPNPLVSNTTGLTPLSLRLRGGKGPGVRGATATVTQENALHLEIAADSPTGGMLVLADTYYPGWHASVDGQSAEIYRANLNFRGVHILAGKHTIKMDYEPESWRIGVYVSVFSLGIFFVLLTTNFILRKRATP